VANYALNAKPFAASGREKVNLNFRSDGKIRYGKQAHAYIAEVNANRIDVD